MQSNNFNELIQKKQRYFFKIAMRVPGTLVTNNLHRLDCSNNEKIYILRHVMHCSHDYNGYDITETLYYVGMHVAYQIGIDRTALYRIERELVRRGLIHRETIGNQKAKCLTKKAITALSFVETIKQNLLA